MEKFPKWLRDPKWIAGIVVATLSVTATVISIVNGSQEPPTVAVGSAVVSVICSVFGWIAQAWAALLFGILIGGIGALMVANRLGRLSSVPKSETLASRRFRLSDSIDYVAYEARHTAQYDGPKSVMAKIYNDLVSLQLTLAKFELEGAIFPLNKSEFKIGETEISQLVGNLEFVSTMLKDNHLEQAVYSAKQMGEQWANAVRVQSIKAENTLG